MITQVSERASVTPLRIFIGPGQYAQQKEQVTKSYKESQDNSFKTKVARFCPTQPGASVFNAPTYI